MIGRLSLVEFSNVILYLRCNLVTFVLFHMQSLRVTLSSHVILSQDGSVHRLYGLASLSKYFVPNQDGASLAPALLKMQDRVTMGVFGVLFLISLCFINCMLNFYNQYSYFSLKDYLLEWSVPYMKTHNGMDGFAVAAIDSRINNLINQSK